VTVCVICGEECYLTKPEDYAQGGQVCYACDKLTRGRVVDIPLSYDGRALYPQEYDALSEMAFLGMMTAKEEYKFQYYNIIFSRFFPDKGFINKKESEKE